MSLPPNFLQMLMQVVQKQSSQQPSLGDIILRKQDVMRKIQAVESRLGRGTVEDPNPPYLDENQRRILQGLYDEYGMLAQSEKMLVEKNYNPRTDPTVSDQLNRTGSGLEDYLFDTGGMAGNTNTNGLDVDFPPSPTEYSSQRDYDEARRKYDDWHRREMKWNWEYSQSRRRNK